MQGLGGGRAGEAAESHAGRRRKFEENPRLAWDILEAGTQKARKAAGETMDDVRAAMGMSLAYEAPKVAESK